MIDFEYWFEGIVSTCELIVRPDAFERTWIHGDETITSIHYPDELFEQLLGDLDMEGCLPQFSDRLRKMDVLETVSTFMHALLSLEKRIKGEPALGEPKALLTSEHWSGLKVAARQVLDSPAAKDYATGRKDITL